ncbi:MAG TPA: hypothetical protein VIH85_13075 [Solirubrobacteraceae bacterium]
MQRVVHHVCQFSHRHVRLAVLLSVATIVLGWPHFSLAATVPAGWPDHVALGTADSPGNAQSLHAHSGVDMRYQYLAGGVNTGHGWSTWNPNGSFVTMYVSESLAAHTIPVFTYYQMLDSAPSVGGSEQARDLSNMRNPSTMSAYWSDYELLLRRIAQSAGNHLVVVHVEPDLWGYLEQAHATVLARSFAQRLIALRNQLAPHVLLAYHLSAWGTDENLTDLRRPLSAVDQQAALSASFYESLHAHFDLVFNDVTDRDAGYYQYVEGNPHTWWGPADFAREDRYIAGFTRRTHTSIVLWQLPVGDTHQNNTWTHYQDNRLQWWFGPGSAAHLRATRNAGVIGFLFGAGASGCTTAETDGGFFFGLARRYEQHPLSLN